MGENHFKFKERKIDCTNWCVFYVHRARLIKKFFTAAKFFFPYLSLICGERDISKSNTTYMSESEDYAIVVLGIQYFPYEWSQLKRTI